MGNLEECKKYGEYVCREACKFSSPNYNFLVGKAKSILSGAYKQQGDFAKAEELLESSTEVRRRQSCIAITSKMQIQLKKECHPLHTNEKDEHWTAVVNGFKHCKKL